MDKLSMADPELEDLRKQCITKLYLCANNIFKYLDENQEEQIGNLKSYMASYCLQEAEQNVLHQVSEEVKIQSDASNIDTIEERFSSCMKHKTKAVRVKEHPCMIKLDKIIVKGKGGASNNLDETDVVLTNKDEVFIDQLTLKPIEDPVRNALCGHVYERESILSHIKNGRKKALCPVAGCGNKESVQKEHLILE